MFIAPTSSPPSIPRLIIVRLVAAASLAGAISLLLRSSIGVLGPDLVQEFSIGPEKLSLLAGVFFLVFAAIQLPVGLLLDRFGPRLVSALFLGIAVVGCVVFAAAGSFAMLLVGRIIMGVGCGALMISGFVLLSRWFPAETYARASSVMVAFGNTGTLLATAPLGAAAVFLGWRGAFLSIAVIAGVALILVLLFERDTPPGHALAERPAEKFVDSLQGVWLVLRDRRMPYILSLAVIGYPVIAAVLALWGGPYLHDVHGLDTVARSNVMGAMAVAVMFAPLFWANLARYVGLRRTVMAGSGACFCALFLLAVIPDPSLYLATGLFVLLGASGGYAMLLLAITRLTFPDHMTGRAMTTVNVAIVGGVSVVQVMTGFVVGAFPEIDGLAPPLAYRTLFGVLAAAILIGIFFFRRMEPIPGDGRAA